MWLFLPENNPLQLMFYTFQKEGGNPQNLNNGTDAFQLT